MKYSLIASSSQGNCLLIIEKNTAILIDMGIAIHRVETELYHYGLTFNKLAAILYTHDHSDHLIDYKQIDWSKVYALEGAIEGKTYHELELFKEYQIGDLKITPLETEHDVGVSCGYLVKGEGESLVYITDTGKFVKKDFAYINNPTYLLLESNHDISMLIKSNRSYELKNRIMADSGHLSNEDSALAATKIVGPNTREVTLCHLSQECNTPEKAMEAYTKMFLKFHIDITKFELKCGKPDEVVRGGDQ